MSDTRDYANNFTFDELVITVESHTDRIFVVEICSRERFVDYEHLRRVVAIAFVKQTSALQLHAGGLKERRRHDTIISDSFIRSRRDRLAVDPKRLPHCATAERQV